MQPTRIEPKIGEPVNDLIWSLNFYMTLGDHFGTAVGFDPPGQDKTVLSVAVNRDNELDQENFEKLRARLAQIRDENGLAASLNDEEEREDQFEFWTLHVPEDEIQPLAEALREKPGPKGYGSTYDLMRERGLITEDHSINEDLLP